MISFLLAAALAQDAAREDALRKISTQRLTVDFENVRLAEAIDFLRDATGLNLVLLPSAGAKDAEQPVRLKARELTVKSVLKLLLQGRGLTVSWRDGALAVVPVEEVEEQVTLRIYDVRSHLLKLPDHPGPRMELATPTGAGPIPTGIVLTLEEPRVILEPDLLIDLVKDHTGGRTWGNSRASIELLNGRLVVNQSAAVHREISDFLRRLGQYR